MRGEPVILAGLLKSIGGVNASQLSEEFNQRLLLQKTVEILQDGFGVNLGYDDFNWYHHGPYSPALARDGFRAARFFSSAQPRHFVDPPVNQRFQEFVQWLRPHAGQARWLEEFASVLFCAKRKESPDVAYGRMVAKLPGFQRADFDRIWAEANQLIATHP
jgi:hypothetical protein